MIEDFFPAHKYINISKSEYEFASNNINSIVFEQLYQKGIKKILVEEQDINGNTFKVEKEQTSFIKYNVSPEQSERLYQYFGTSCFDNKLNDTNEQFNAFRKQIKFINDIIEPVLNDLEIEYELHLAGGALRDHLLNRQVKDLDILIEFHDKFQMDKQFGRDSLARSKSQQEAIEKFFIEKDSMLKKHEIEIFHGQSREKFLHEIIFQTINKIEKLELKEFFWEKTENEDKNPRELTELTPDDSLIYQGLFSVLKVNKNEFQYPVDLLLNSSMLSYLSSFDFEICKCSYRFKGLTKYIYNEETKLFLMPGFVNDVLNSTLSLNTQIFGTEKQVDRCLKDHYLRLKKKYPEHEIQLINVIQDSQMTRYIEKAHKYFSLEDRLKPKETETKTKIKKI